VKVAQYQVPYTFYRLLNDQSTSVSTEKLIEIKKMVSHYLPGMNQGNLKISKFAQQGLKQMVPGEYNERITADHHNQIVVTLHQEIKSRQNTHQHFARATIDASGKVIKLAISR
jgi:hypothetical protein